MKKLLLGVFALVSVSAMAETHVYGKFGVDLNTKYGDVTFYNGQPVFSNGGKGTGFFLEATKDISPNVELGMGIGYIHRSNGKSKSNIYEDEDFWTWTSTRNTPRYSSVPLYIVGKYNFNVDSKVRPYVKVDIGYSMNKANKNVTSYGVNVNDPSYTYEHHTKVKVRNGIYAGIGAGVEYHNFLAELSYHYTEARLDIRNSQGYSYLGEEKNYQNKAVSFSVGYKFNF